jgi:hypothetical protein
VNAGVLRRLNDGFHNRRVEFRNTGRKMLIRQAMVAILHGRASKSSTAIRVWHISTIASA